MRYPTPGSLGYLWNFGVSSLMFLVLQIITGAFLSMHYVPSEDAAFNSVEDIMRNVNYGWLFRYMHSNGASFFFISVYIHMLRNIYYLSFVKPRHIVWYSGCVIFILMIITAFTGYVLPWGQMSFWAATVITNLFSVLPFCGNEIVVWIWGDYGVSSSTLNRFYTIHFVLPIVIAILAMYHIFVLHAKGSSNKLSIFNIQDNSGFHPFFIYKDFKFLIIILIIFLGFVGFAPNALGHPDNYIPADPMVTPEHIVPEWYFLPFYAMLRCVPNKSLGIIILALSIIQLFLLPSMYPSRTILTAKIGLSDWILHIFPNKYFDTEEVKKFSRLTLGFRLYSFFFWGFFVNCVFLGILGAKPLEYPYIELSRVCTFFYFAFFFIGAFIFSDHSARGRGLISLFTLLYDSVYMKFLKIWEDTIWPFLFERFVLFLAFCHAKTAWFTYLIQPFVELLAWIFMGISNYIEKFFKNLTKKYGIDFKGPSNVPLDNFTKDLLSRQDKGGFYGQILEQEKGVPYVCIIRLMFFEPLVALKKRIAERRGEEFRNQFNKDAELLLKLKTKNNSNF